MARTPGTFLVAGLLLVLGACGGDGGGSDTTTSVPPRSALRIESPAFADGAPIPAEFTCDGGDAVPPLRWSGAPEGTAEVALVVDDPDAPGGSFVHWVVWGLPPDGEITGGRLPAGAREGGNGFGATGWRGPCPPGGGEHRYEFQLAAVSEPLDLPDGASADDLRAAVSGRTLGAAVLTGTYGR